MKARSVKSGATFFPTQLTQLPSRPKGLRWDPQRNAWDKGVKRLQREGFTFEAIAGATGLSYSQVAYRCGKKTGFSFRKFRAGQSPEAQAQIHRIQQLLGLCKKLRSDADKLLERTRQPASARINRVAIRKAPRKAVHA